MNNINIASAVENNAIWVRRYNVTSESEAVTNIISKHCQGNKVLKVVDVGCGNGRSIELLTRVLGKKHDITGIDIRKENIDYCKGLFADNQLKLKLINAFDFFLLNENEANIDILLFSWSLFDMVDESDPVKKFDKLTSLLNLAKRCLTCEGVILILQPTKGGVFEQLLSKFMPGSDEDYELVHDVLINNKFFGAKSAFPKTNNPWAIWSEFDYTAVDDIYKGVESILYLEQRKLLTKEQFLKVWEEFCVEQGCRLDQRLKLTDCVNLYYWMA